MSNEALNKQNEILKKRISNYVIKENVKGLSRQEAHLKRDAIKQFYQVNHQLNHK